MSQGVGSCIFSSCVAASRPVLCMGGLPRERMPPSAAAPHRCRVPPGAARPARVPPPPHHHIFFGAGLEMSEPATDLAVACAIASSYFEQPIARDVALIGEVRPAFQGALRVWLAACCLGCCPSAAVIGRVAAQGWAKCNGALSVPHLKPAMRQPRCRRAACPLQAGGAGRRAAAGRPH